VPLGKLSGANKNARPVTPSVKLTLTSFLFFPPAESFPLPDPD
jgi:hypothetical protein